MARLIRTEKEVEGRYEEVWIVVDEDALDQWPAGPLTTVGQKVPRVDGLTRVRGEALYTADLQLPGMLHTAVLRSPYARARVTSIDLEPARSAPGVRAAIGPADLDQLTDEPGYVGHAVAAVAADTFGQAQAAVERIAVAVGSARAAARPRRGGAAGVVRLRRSEVRARRLRARARRGRRGRRGRVPNAGRAPQLDGDASSGLSLGGRRDHHLHLDAVHLGHPRVDGRPRSASRPTRCASSAMRWAEASGRRTVPATTRRSRPSSRRGRRGRSSAR